MNQEDKNSEEKLDISPHRGITLSEFKRKIESQLRNFGSKVVATKDALFGPKSVEWKKDDFDLLETIKGLNSPVIEVAGPTDRGFELIDESKLDREVWVSNISPGYPMWNDNTGEFIGYFGKVDFQADATTLPFATDSLGGILASCLPSEVREDAIKEASRSLKEGGVLVWQGGVASDIKTAEDGGFEAVQYTKKRISYTDNRTGDVYNVIFQKNSTRGEN
jgi:hypothetical protein